MFSLRRAFLRLWSLWSGVPYGKLKLLHLIGVRLDQVLIVKRGEDVVLDEWSDSWQSQKGSQEAGQPGAITSILPAINEFIKRPAASGTGGSRLLEVGDARVHLRATPTYILAAKCGGLGSRKLEGHINAALRGALEATPALLFFTAGHAGDLQGTARKIGSTVEKLLLDANLPPHGVVRRPVFAYAAIAVLTLSGITAIGEAIMYRYIVPKDMTDGIKERMAGSGASAKEVAGPQSEKIVGASAYVAVTLQFLLGNPVERRTAQTSHSPLQLSPPAANGAPGAISDKAVESALSNLTNFDPGIGVKFDSLNSADLLQQPATYNIPSHSGLLPRMPVTLTGQGVRVDLFSTGSGGSSVFSGGGPSPASDVPVAGSVAGAAGETGSGVTADVAQTASAPLSAATSGLNNVTSTARKLLP